MSILCFIYLFYRKTGSFIPYMLFLLLSIALAKDSGCVKNIEVQYLYRRVSPVIFHQPQKPWREGAVEKIKIDCGLYDKVKTGDLLEDAEESGLEQVRLSEGSQDGGYLEYRYYKVLKKF